MPRSRIRTAFAVAPLLLAFACASSTEDDAATKPTTSTDAGADAPADVASEEASAGGDAGTDAPAEATVDAPADTGADAPPPVTPTGNFAVWKVYLGDFGYDDVASATAWQAYADDVDGKTTTASSTDVCTRYAGAPASIQADGPNGADDSFGANLLPSLSALAAGLSQQLNTNLANGEATLLVRTDLLANPGAGDHATWAYTTTKLVSPPELDGTDVYEIDQASLTGPTLDEALAVDPQATLTGDTLVVVPGQTVVISSSYAGAVFGFKVHHAKITMQLDANRGRVLQGRITGVLDTDEFVSDLRAVIGNVNSSFCSGFVWDTVENSIRQAQDILSDGTNQAGAPCDGISVAIGFKAVAASYGPNPKTVPAPADPCAP